jgi:hypothetical protein
LGHCLLAFHVGVANLWPEPGFAPVSAQKLMERFKTETAPEGAVVLTLKALSLF